jgi:L-ascorbate metabolism protein UlaG (beta-lactamase superfamily)
MDPNTPLADPDAGSIFFAGTATTVIRFGGFTVLTDPNFLHRGEVVRLGYGLRSRRRTEPALQPEGLPPLDVLVLSHLHEDHFDRVAQARLPRSVPIVTTPSAAATLARRGFRNPEPVRTWNSVAFRRGPSRLLVTSLPARHGPPVVSALLPDTMGSMLDFERDGVRRLRLYVSGDTLIHRRLREIPARYPDIDVALLHLGGTRIGGVLLTMNGKQGIEALRIVRPRTAIPIHYDDYPLFRSPLGDFQERVRAEGLEQHVHYLARGESFDFRLGLPAPGLRVEGPAPSFPA